MAIPDFGPYSIADLEALIDAAKHALESKMIIATAEAKIDEILTDVKKAQGRNDGDAWVQPTGAHDAYARGAKVTYLGKTWINLTSANDQIPGISGWREFVPEGSVPAWVQPSGSLDVYTMGAIVSHNGKTWRNTHPANVWEPGTVGTEALWAEVPA